MLDDDLVSYLGAADLADSAVNENYVHHFNKEAAMNFIAIDPRQRTVKFVEAKTLTETYPAVGLDLGEVDHGTVLRDADGSGAAIVVYQYSLYIPPEEAYYFSLGRTLYSGGAILYAFDSKGDTCDFKTIADAPPPIMFYKDHHQVEAAIQRNEIARPITAVNDEVLWKWPDKR
jgi:hypothetical protein